jgi:hypothetical protein
MAILGSSYWNLIDVLKAGGDGLGDVVEALTQLTPFMKDANVVACNSGTEHRSTIRTGLPSVSWGALYQGIAQSKGNYTEVKDTTGFVEGCLRWMSACSTSSPPKRPSCGWWKARAFESIAQTVESAIWYSDVKVNGKQFHGLAPRYNSLSNANVVNGGGTGSDNTSIWFVTHGDMQTSVIVPDAVPPACSARTWAASACSMAMATPIT